MTTLADYHRDQRDAQNELMLRELVDRHGGRLPGETWERAAQRIRLHSDAVYQQSIIRLRAAAEGLRKLDEEYAGRKAG
jgi:hypothetical protein